MNWEKLVGTSKMSLLQPPTALPCLGKQAYNYRNPHCLQTPNWEHNDQPKLEMQNKGGGGKSMGRLQNWVPWFLFLASCYIYKNKSLWSKCLIRGREGKGTHRSQTWAKGCPWAHARNGGGSDQPSSQCQSLPSSPLRKWSYPCSQLHHVINKH